MALVPMEKDVSGWSAEVTFTPASGSEAVSSYGSLKGRYNSDLKLAVVKWAGNGSAPSTFTSYYFTLPDEFKATGSYGTSLDSAKGANMEKQTTSILVQLPANRTWTIGELMYPTV